MSRPSINNNNDNQKVVENWEKNLVVHFVMSLSLKGCGFEFKETDFLSRVLFMRNRQWESPDLTL